MALLPRLTTPAKGQGRPIIDTSAQGVRKRQRERERRAKFTVEQRQAAFQHQQLYMLHRRRTDVEYLAKCRATVRVQYQKHRAKRIEGMREKHWRTRVLCLQAYGGSNPFCGCCGEQSLEFLTRDHIVDRKSDGGVRVGGDRVGQTLYAWLIRMGFPAGFRVLCYNCNCSRGARGYCPHELKLQEEIERVAI